MTDEFSSSIKYSRVGHFVIDLFAAGCRGHDLCEGGVIQMQPMGSSSSETSIVFGHCLGQFASTPFLHRQHFWLCDVRPIVHHAHSHCSYSPIIHRSDHFRSYSLGRSGNGVPEAEGLRAKMHLGERLGRQDDPHRGEWLHLRHVVAAHI